MSPIEILGAALGIANVFLIARRSMWNWVIGIAMTMVYTYIFYDAKLYSDTILQVFFTVVQLIGWWMWQVKKDEDGDVNVSTLGGLGLTAWALGAVAVGIVAGWFFHAFTDASYPFVDSMVLGLSVAGQLLLNSKKVEAWLFWIAVDLIGIPLYWVKGLYPTAGLYIVFLGLAIYGGTKWIMRHEDQEDERLMENLRAELVVDIENVGSH